MVFEVPGGAVGSRRAEKRRQAGQISLVARGLKGWPQVGQRLFTSGGWLVSAGEAPAGTGGAPVLPGASVVADRGICFMGYL